MDYTGSSYSAAVIGSNPVSTSAGGAGGGGGGLDSQHFNASSSASACHFGQQEDPGSPADHCNGPLSSSSSAISPLLGQTSSSVDGTGYASTALFHHHSHLLLHNHHQHQSNYPADDLASPFNIYGAHQRHHGATSLGSILSGPNSGGGRGQSSMTPSSSSANNNTSSLAAAAASLFAGSGFHGNGFTPLSTQSSAASRTATCSSSTSHYGTGSSFFPHSNHLQGSLD